MTRQQRSAPGNQLAEVPAGRLIARMAERFGVDDKKLIQTLKATAFKSETEPTNEQMMALMVVADQYGLNPFTKELFAFPDKKNGIVPVVSVDGWSRIINEHKQFDGLEFRYSDDSVEMDDDAKPCPAWCEVVIHRKDRGHPSPVREYLDEVYRPAFTGKNRESGREFKIPGPWQSHTKRMLRHKTLIQGARVVFGFAGIYDEDEATRIIDANAIDGEFTVVSKGKPATRRPTAKAADDDAPEGPATESKDDFVADMEAAENKQREPGEEG